MTSVCDLCAKLPEKDVVEIFFSTIVFSPKEFVGFDDLSIIFNANFLKEDLNISVKFESANSLMSFVEVQNRLGFGVFALHAQNISHLERLIECGDMVIHTENKPIMHVIISKKELLENQPNQICARLDIDQFKNNLQNAVNKISIYKNDLCDSKNEESSNSSEINVIDMTKLKSILRLPIQSNEHNTLAKNASQNTMTAKNSLHTPPDRFEHIKLILATVGLVFVGIFIGIFSK